MAVTFTKPDEIASVSDFAHKVAALPSGRILFRGQNVDLPLLPKIARHTALSADALEVAEQRMLNRFKREGAPFLNGMAPANDWDWLSIAQHQGMPTRLLDWTTNSLAALWFAVATDPPEGHEAGVVWVLSLADEDLSVPRHDENPFKVGHTRVFQPFHVDKRIAAQAGWFSVHKYSESAGKFVPLDQHRTYKNKVRRLRIQKAHFSTIRDALRRMGLTRATLFPDLSGLCADIQEEYLLALRPANSI